MVADTKWVCRLVVPRPVVLYGTTHGVALTVEQDTCCCVGLIRGDGTSSFHCRAQTAACTGPFPCSGAPSFLPCVVSSFPCWVSGPYDSLQQSLSMACLFRRPVVVRRLGGSSPPAPRVSPLGAEGFCQVPLGMSCLWVGREIDTSVAQGCQPTACYDAMIWIVTMLASAELFVVPFGRTLLTMLFLSLLSLLAHHRRLRLGPGRFLRATAAGIPQQVALPLGCVADPRGEVLSWKPWMDRKGRVGRRVPASARVRRGHNGFWGSRLCGHLLGALLVSLPICVWSTPPAEWHEAVGRMDEHLPFLSDLPDPLPAPAADETARSPSPGADYGSAFLWDNRLCATREGAILTCHFLVMSPMFHPEILPLAVRVPGEVEPFMLQEVRSALCNLHLEFARKVSATFPQLHPGYASVVVGGDWLEVAGEVIVVLDFRQFGGPAFAQHLSIDGRFSDLRHAASWQGISDFAVYLFGQHVPLPDGASFRALHGGVVQFVPPCGRPVWHGSLQDKLMDRQAWFAFPLTNLVPFTSTLVLDEHRTFVFRPPGREPQPVMPPDKASLADSLGLEARSFTVAYPARDQLRDVSHQGSLCAFCAAVQHSPPPDAAADAGIFVFIDARQVGCEPIWTWIRSNPDQLSYLAGFAGVARVPPGFHISVVGSFAGLDGDEVHVSQGETVVIGFRADGASDEGSSVNTSEPVALNADFSRSTASHPESDPEGSSSSSSSTSQPARSGHSRSPRRPAAQDDALPFEPHLSECKVLPEHRGVPGPRAVAAADEVGRPEGIVAAQDPEHSDEDRIVGPDPDPASEESSEGAGEYQATTHILVPDRIPEQVDVVVSVDDGIQELLEVIAEARDHDQYLRFPHVVPAMPQPARHWGVLLAFPAWAVDEHLACADCRDLDGRLFAMDVPFSATKAQLCSLAGITQLDQVSLFAYGSRVPMTDDDEVEYVSAGTLVFSSRPHWASAGLPLRPSCGPCRSTLLLCSGG